MAINNLYTAQYRFEGAGSGFTCTTAYEQIAGTNDFNTLTQLAVALAVLLETPFKNALPSNIDMTSILTFQVTGANETPGRTVFQQPNGGALASNALPMGAAAVISFKTVAPSSKFNGRIFIGGVAEANSNFGAITAAGIVLYQAIITALLEEIPLIGDGEAEFRLVTISRFEDGEERPIPIGFEVIQGSVNPFVKQQRRRNTKFLGVGPATP